MPVQVNTIENDCLNDCCLEVRDQAEPFEVSPSPVRPLTNALVNGAVVALFGTGSSVAHRKMFFVVPLTAISISGVIRIAKKNITA